jgi:hypothetical protein
VQGVVKEKSSVQRGGYSRGARTAGAGVEQGSGALRWKLENQEQDAASSAGQSWKPGMACMTKR